MYSTDQVCDVITPFGSPSQEELGINYYLVLGIRTKITLLVDFEIVLSEPRPYLVEEH